MIVFGHDDEVAHWVSERIPHAGNLLPCRALCVVKEERIVGGVVYSNFRDGDLEMSWAGDPGWTSRALFQAAFGYPFNQLGCRRVTAIIPKHEKYTRRMAEKLGYVQEGVHRKAFENDTAISYGMLRENCRWLT